MIGYYLYIPVYESPANKKETSIKHSTHGTEYSIKHLGRTCNYLPNWVIANFPNDIWPKFACKRCVKWHKHTHTNTRLPKSPRPRPKHIRSCFCFASKQSNRNRSVVRVATLSIIFLRGVFNQKASRLVENMHYVIKFRYEWFIWCANFHPSAPGYGSKHAIHQPRSRCWREARRLLLSSRTYHPLSPAVLRTANHMVSVVRKFPY